MARVNIPRSEYAILLEIAQLPESSFLDFVGGLRALAPDFGQIDLSAPIAKKATSIGVTEIKSFLRTLFSLYRLADVKERSAEEMAADVKEAVERDKPKGFSPDDKNRLQGRLKILLEIGGMLSTASKAVDLMSEQERIFCGARIISDMRPVFTSSPDSIAAALVTHSLKISFHENGDHKDFYVVLTPGELKALKKVVDRAEKKSDSIKSFIQKSGVQLINDGE
jgi:hypothetical protein